MRDWTEKGRPGRMLTAWRWPVVALLGVAASCLLAEALAGVEAASVPAPGTSGAAGPGTAPFVVAGQITPDTYGLYLVDPQNDTICVYQYLSAPRPGKLKLVAARTYHYDAQLDEYQTDPSPGEIKLLVEKQRRLRDVETPAATQP